jgi:hypothetical protein
MGRESVRNVSSYCGALPVNVVVIMFRAVAEDSKG